MRNSIFGNTGAGKTTLANAITGSRLKVGSSLQSCTEVVEMAKPITHAGRTVNIYDTPGFDDSRNEDIQTLQEITETLRSHGASRNFATGLIFVHDINMPRMSGQTLKNLKMFKDLVGEDAFSNVVIVTNKWSEPPLPEQENRERELRMTEGYFGDMISRGAQLHRCRSNPDPGDALRLLDMFETHRPRQLQVQREMPSQSVLSLLHSTAGQSVESELNETEALNRTFLQDTQREVKRRKGQKRRSLIDNAREREQELRRRISKLTEFSSNYEEDSRGSARHEREAKPVLSFLARIIAALISLASLIAGLVEMFAE
ncbi:P-loop containing nucleoside triphosphate hydrolase protein [Ceratobasidium sp. AG-I]|nr:P-loop containing nucleoside triphosphate hydrolase protein [Ceratobasidium sp. AG-I]